MLSNGHMNAYARPHSAQILQPVLPHKVAHLITDRASVGRSYAALVAKGAVGICVGNIIFRCLLLFGFYFFLLAVLLIFWFLVCSDSKPFSAASHEASTQHTRRECRP